MPMLVDDFDELLTRARRRDGDAIGTLLTSQHNLVVCVISARLDRRIKARIDVDDVVQEVWLEAVSRFAEYAKDPRMSFRDWLQHVALDCVSRCHRRHIRTKKRSVCVEVHFGWQPKHEDVFNRLSSAGQSERSTQDEEGLLQRIGRLVKSLPASDQDLLRMRIIEEIPVRQVAMILQMTEAAVRLKQFRILRRLHRCLIDVNRRERGERNFETRARFHVASREEHSLPC
jgi:RNA polymerase sigma-70 factor (ECF subfamily)